MPLDPEIKTMIEAWEALNLPRVETLSGAEARALYASLERPAVDLPVERSDRTLQGAGGALRIRTYRPPGEGPFGALVYFHGGGWVVGSIDTHDGTCQRLCHGSGYVVIAVDYRLAPEDPYPAGFDDCIYATSWVATNAAELSVDPRRLAVGGDSAGGNLAAAVALAARDRGGPPIDFQLLVYPAVDSNFTRPSCTENAEGYVLTMDDLKWYWDQYQPNVAARTHPYCTPFNAPSLSGLPAALVITAEFDPLRDEGNDYADRLAQHGVPTTRSQYAGAIHGFFGKSEGSSLARSAMQEACDALRDRRP
ncbi:MAG: alpha/beta hydrolase [Polyangiales bacterium]